MNWTKDKPTEPGWYWVRTSSPKREPFVAEIAHEAPHGLFLRSGSGYGWVQWLPTHEWAGPIPPPSEDV